MKNAQYLEVLLGELEFGIMEKLEAMVVPVAGHVILQVGEVTILIVIPIQLQILDH